ncbi:metallopeptidase [Candidatus Parvarchaeota archaeon]|nr:MAG: metallopeptidase [Candidatus Parvarchaeota archaeon]
MSFFQEEIKKKMKYESALDLEERMREMVNLLFINHIKIDRVKCLRSYGSRCRRTIARVHTLGKAMQKGMEVGAFYTIEFLEKFDKLNKEEQDKVIIHELMHIPKTFGGGFRQHDYVCDKNVELMHERFLNLKRTDF